MADEQATETWSPWRSRISAARKRRDDLVSEWQENVDLRRGRGPKGGSKSTSINQDWPLTKAKIAQLYSQTPEVRLTPRDPAFQEAVPVFSRRLNDVIADSDVGAAVTEVAADVVNAAGIGGVLVSCEKRTEPREVPVVDPAMLPPEAQQAIATGALEIPTETIDVVTDIRYPAQRISPTDLLIPSDFTGSVYDQSRWLGHDGRMTWAQATVALGLTDAQKDDVLGADRRADGVSNTLNTDSQKFRDTEVVNYTEIFYRRHFYHAEETSFLAIQRLVFVDGIDEPVINEPYTGQKRLEDGTIVGMRRLPIRILTLTYISDDSLPPSDSTIGRFQVNELTASRDAMVQQRKHSIPIRWFDSNRVSGNTRTLLEKGTFQGFIPTNGPGDRAVGEVARASFPQEKFDFDRVIKGDLTEIWQVGTNQAGAFSSGDRSASEANIIQQNFQTRVGQERDRVSQFFVGIAECQAGLMAIYDERDLPMPEGIPKEAIANGFVYSVRVDSTVLLDASEQIERLQRGLNLTAQSGYVNPKPVISKIWELLGEDPSQIVIDPQPKAPEPVHVAVSKAEDLMSPLFIAMLLRTGQGPEPADLEAAKKLLVAAHLPSVPMPPPQPDAGPTEGIETPGIANPGWEAAPRIERRAEDGGA
jgi:hypothetical protein